MVSFLFYRLMKQTANAVLNAFRPGPTPGTVNPHGTPPTPAPTHQDELHSTALIKLSQGTCILQHHTLKFVSSLFLAEPGASEHLKAEGLWELAYGDAFFFWNAEPGPSHAAPGELVLKSAKLAVHLYCQQLELLHLLYVAHQNDATDSASVMCGSWLSAPRGRRLCIALVQTHVVLVVQRPMV